MKRHAVAPDCDICHYRHGKNHKAKEAATGYSCIQCNHLQTWLDSQIRLVEQALQMDMAIMIGLLVFMGAAVIWSLAT